MGISELKISNSFRINPKKFHDRRGVFFETFRASSLTDALGYPFVVAQGNLTVSKKGTLRGIHGTALPPGQEKLVTCVRGAALDIVVDLRVGSPTFGEFDITELTEESGVSIYVADGIGHAYLALADDTSISYVCSTEYVPGTMVDIDAMDPQLGLPWGLENQPLRSDKDTNAPTIAQAAERGLLATYEKCLLHYEELRTKRS